MSLEQNYLLQWEPNEAVSNSGSKQDTAIKTRGGEDPWEQETHTLCSSIAPAEREAPRPRRGTPVWIQAPSCTSEARKSWPDPTHPPGQWGLDGMWPVVTRQQLSLVIGVSLWVWPAVVTTCILVCWWSGQPSPTLLLQWAPPGSPTAPTLSIGGLLNGQADKHCTHLYCFRWYFIVFKSKLWPILATNDHQLSNRILLFSEM